MSPHALLVLAAAACTLAFAPPEQQFTTISGKVVDRSGGVPLSQAVVQVKGTSLGAITKPDGTYAIERVPLGKHVIRIVRVGSQPFESKPVEVSAEGVVIDARLLVSGFVCTMTISTGLTEPGSGMLAPYSTAIIRFD